MLRLKNRQSSIPNGLTFHQPEVPTWKPSFQPSFNSLCQQVLAMRRANPYLAQKSKWAMDPRAIEDEVDHFNALICQRMGWDQYIQSDQGSTPPPKQQGPSHPGEVAAAAGRAAKIWSGVKTTNEWIDSGVPAVAGELAEKRALVCAGCQQNGQGDFTRWFTSPASEAIKRQIQKVSDRKLVTSQDAKLNICEVCLCPLKLKVHTPLEFIKMHILPAVLAELKRIPDCWIPKELEGK
jgi:hypothetical protein